MHINRSEFNPKLTPDIPHLHDRHHQLYEIDRSGITFAGYTFFSLKRVHADVRLNETDLQITQVQESDFIFLTSIYTREIFHNNYTAFSELRTADGSIPEADACKSKAKNAVTALINGSLEHIIAKELSLQEFTLKSWSSVYRISNDKIRVSTSTDAAILIPASKLISFISHLIQARGKTIRSIGELTLNQLSQKLIHNLASHEFRMKEIETKLSNLPSRRDTFSIMEKLNPRLIYSRGHAQPSQIQYLNYLQTQLAALHDTSLLLEDHRELIHSIEKAEAKRSAAKKILTGNTLEVMKSLCFTPSEILEILHAILKQLAQDIIPTDKLLTTIEQLTVDELRPAFCVREFGGNNALTIADQLLGLAWYKLLVNEEKTADTTSKPSEYKQALMPVEGFAQAECIYEHLMAERIYEIPLDERSPTDVTSIDIENFEKDSHAKKEAEHGLLIGKNPSSTFTLRATANEFVPLGKKPF